jgi:predicted transcriptional regulator
MLKVAYNPNAYLTQKRNVRLGLNARSKILEVLEKRPASTRDIGEATGLKYAVVLYHLKLLEDERTVRRQVGKKPYFWAFTGIGQRRLAGS